MYYIRFTVNFKKTADSAPYSLHVKVDIKKVGNDLSTYCSKMGTELYHSLCIARKVHTAFDVQPTKVVYNVDLNMNQKKILNITLDKNRSNSAAPVKLVTDLEAKLGPYIIQRIMCIEKSVSVKRRLRTRGKMQTECKMQTADGE